MYGQYLEHFYLSNTYLLDTHGEILNKNSEYIKKAVHFKGKKAAGRTLYFMKMMK